MNILFAWTGLTSYMADCWRRLAVEPGVTLKILIDVSGAGAKGVAFDAGSVMRDLDYEIVTSSRSSLDPSAFAPDILFAVGWHSPLCRALVSDPRLQDVPKVCCFDMPWRWQLRCLLAPLVLGRFLRHYQAAYVPGAVCTRYANWLGFARIYQGLFSINTQKFAPAPNASPSAPAAYTYFLYIGRNSTEKRLGDIREAHRRYRARGGTLDLRMYGKDLEGGFVKPEEVPALMHGAAAFVLASDFDPWPLVLLEAMSAGCPVIASDRCTNRPELGADWRVFKVGDVEALAREMADAERHPPVVRAPVPVVLTYDCKAWVERVMTIVAELKGR